MPISDWLIQAQGLPVLLIWILQAFFVGASILLLLRFFGEAGLYVYIVSAMFVANLQLLKVVDFPLMPDPIPLGTLIFASIYLATDILNEHYGPGAARRAVLIGFFGYLMVTILILFTLGFEPLPADYGEGEYAWAHENHARMSALLTPIPVFFASGMIAYLCSQFADVWLYQKIRRKTGGKKLWLRNNLSTMLSAVIDNAIFNLFAWVILAEQPLPLKVIFFSYFLGTLLMKLVIALIDTPLLYLARHCLPRDYTPKTT